MGLLGADRTDRAHRATAFDRPDGTESDRAHRATASDRPDGTESDRAHRATPSDRPHRSGAGTDWLRRRPPSVAGHEP